MSDVEALERAIDDVKKDVTGMRDDLKEIAVALRDLVHLDKKVTDHEKRIRYIEIRQAGNSKSVGLFDWVVQRALSAAVGAVIATVLITQVGG